MATNPYFSQGRKSEQLLYEDLIIESIKAMGQDVYYCPREIVAIDKIFVDDIPSRFSNAYKVEMYIENAEGFDGEGDLFQKFGVEIRDAATFVISRRRWNTVVAENETADGKPFYRPREGDLIYLPLSNSIFQIAKVEDESPFYQLKNLPTFRLRCELFEYSDEDFDTGIDDLDRVEVVSAYQQKITFVTASGTFEIGEEVTQANVGYTLKGEVVDWDGVNKILYVAHFGSDDGQYHEFNTIASVVGTSSGVTGTPTEIDEELQLGAMNDDLNEIGNSFIDFTESNPFGDPS
jgi:hypothetical protein